MSDKIDLTPHLRFKRVPGETYTFRGTRDGEEVQIVFEPDQPFEVPAGLYTFACLFRGRLAEGANLLPTGATVKASE